MRRELTDEIIVHCSDSDISAHDDISVINQWHIEKGFLEVGYHFFIKQDGTIQQGRNIYEKGAHCYGENNHAIGVCLSGRYSFSDEQFESLWTLVAMLRATFPKVILEVSGHYKYSNKTCPNFSVEDWKTEYNL
jgi:hypothetical protein